MFRNLESNTYGFSRITTLNLEWDNCVHGQTVYDDAPLSGIHRQPETAANLFYTIGTKCTALTTLRVTVDTTQLTRLWACGHTRKLEDVLSSVFDVLGVQTLKWLVQAVRTRPRAKVEFLTWLDQHGLTPWLDDGKPAFVPGKLLEATGDVNMSQSGICEVCGYEPVRKVEPSYISGLMDLTMADLSVEW